MPDFDKFYRSTLTFDALWAPYQGHCILCHRLLELLIDWAIRWNVNAVIGCTYVSLLLDFVLIFALLKGLRAVVSERMWLVLAGCVALSLFSLNQVAIWTIGFNLGPALSVLSVLAGIVCLEKFGARYGALAFCLLAGTVASYSFGNGLTYLVALAPLLYVKLRNGPRRLTKSLLWIVAAFLVIVFYFYHLGGNGTTVTFGQALLNMLRRPGAFFAYWFTCTGASMFFLNGAKAVLPAAVRLAVACGAPLWTDRADRLRDRYLEVVEAPAGTIAPDRSLVDLGIVCCCLGRPGRPDPFQFFADKLRH